MTSPPMFPILDPAQLRRIERSRGGFLYQDLVAVAVALMGSAHGLVSIFIERDEDIQLQTTLSHIYVQVKDERSPLTPSEVAGELLRFERLRDEHASGRRAGPARFVLFLSTAPGPSLAALPSSAAWRGQLVLRWPGVDGDASLPLPPAWKDLGAAFAWCLGRARTVIGTRLAPEALVWKLAGVVAAISTGEWVSGTHELDIRNLPSFFEQLSLEVDRVPSLPDGETYIPHQEEPPYESTDHVRVLAAPTGSGKTAWAAMAAMAQRGWVVYVRGRELRDRQDLAAQLAHRIATVALADSGDALASVLSPAAGGLEAVRTADAILSRMGRRVIVFLDDVHLLRPEDVHEIVATTTHTSWNLLAQRTPAIDTLAALIGVGIVEFRGWGEDDIAAVLGAAGAAAGPVEVARARRFTGGLPRFVRDLSKLLHNAGPDVLAQLRELEAGESINTPSQLAILSATVIARLSDSARALLALSGPLGLELRAATLQKLAAGALKMTQQRSFTAIRELVSWQVLRDAGEGRVEVHGAFQTLATLERGKLDPSVEGRLPALVYEALMAECKQDPGRPELLWALVVAAVDAGEGRVFAEMASTQAEWWREQGYAHELLALVGRALVEFSLDDESRFWLLDSQAFFAVELEQEPLALATLREQHTLAARMPNDQDRWLAIVNRAIQISALRHDYHAAVETYKAIAQDRTAAGAKSYDDIDCVLRYSVGAVIYRCAIERRAKGDNKRCAELLSLAEEWTEALVACQMPTLGFTSFDDFQFTKPSVLIQRMKADKRQNPDRTRRFADCLDLLARIDRELEQDPSLWLSRALTLYTITGAEASAARTVQDLADAYLEHTHDIAGAERMLRKLAAPANADRLVHQRISARSQRAVFLAYAGRLDEAEAEMERVARYRPGMTRAAQAEFDNQTNIIRGLRSRAR